MTTLDHTQAIAGDIQLQTAVPSFMASDVAHTARWYTEQLGFRIAGTVPPAAPYVYASLVRDGIELMLLRRAPEDHGPAAVVRREGVWDAYVRMRGVHAFYETVRDRDFVRMPLRKQPYGDWEFEVQDPNGYILVFSELIA